MSDKVVKFHDTTFRDGPQSLWGMKMNTGMIDAVASDLDQAGFDSMEILTMGHWVYWVRFLREDPAAALRLVERKIKNTPLMITPNMGIHLSPFGPASPMPLVRYYYRTMNEYFRGRWHSMFLITNTRDELQRDFPKIVPLLREMGIKVITYVTYTVSPRHTDEYYADHIRKLQKFEPDAIVLKDVGGLLTVDRAKSLIEVFKREAKNVPLELHAHGMSGNNEAVVVEALKRGIRKIQTCVPPLANGSSHPNIFNVIHNAKVLGLEPDINEEPLRRVEEKLTAIAKQEGLPIGAPALYDERVYSHKIPGGVISVLKNQLVALGIGHRLDQVLEEIPRITAELGHPIMITPHSQFIVSQAAVHIATGERWKDILDCMIEFALGIYGFQDAGVPYMDPNIKDMLLSHPNAKKIAEKWARTEEEADKEESVEEIKKRFGMENTPDEEFWFNYFQLGDEIKNIRAAGPAKSYFTGKDPLKVLLKELSKERDISRLYLRKGNSAFEFRQN